MAFPRPRTHPYTGWLWLTDIVSGGSVLDATGSSSPLSGQLEQHFRHVDRLEPGEAPSRRSYDCIVLHERVRQSLNPSDAGTPTLQHFRALLAPDGWLVGSATNPHCLGSGRLARDGVGIGRMTRAFRRAGFTEVRRIFALPSLDRPMDLVPDTRRAVAAYEGLTSMQDAVSPLRKAVATMGLTSIMYPAYFILGRC